MNNNSLNDYSKNFSFLLKNKEYIKINLLKLNFEITNNIVESTTLSIEYSENKVVSHQVICFYNNKTLKEQLLGHILVVFKEFFKDDMQNNEQIFKIEKLLTFFETMFLNIFKKEYSIDFGNFFFDIPLPLNQNIMELFLFNGVVNNVPYTYEKKDINFNEEDIFYPYFLININEPEFSSYLKRTKDI
jgi:hypothetical protein